LKASKFIWIEKGFTIFANNGPHNLKIETLAKLVDKSKSSFYHHFADLEFFIEALLKHHEKRSLEIANLMQNCKNINPDLINLILTLQDDILFQRQLRIHRNIPAFKNCFEKTHQPIEAAFLNVWANAIGLDKNINLANAILKLTVDNFYLRITPKNLNKKWLIGFLNEYKNMVQSISKIN